MYGGIIFMPGAIQRNGSGSVIEMRDRDGRIRCHRGARAERGQEETEQEQPVNSAQGVPQRGREAPTVRGACQQGEFYRAASPLRGRLTCVSCFVMVF